MENLRKVEYIVCIEGSNKLRNGYFHQWGNDIFSDFDGKHLEVTIGIIEDKETGQIIKVPIENIKFDTGPIRKPDA